MDPCAHRCALVHTLMLALARRDGVTVETVRVGQGLAREYVPATPARTILPPVLHGAGASDTRTTA